MITTAGALKSRRWRIGGQFAMIGLIVLAVGGAVGSGRAMHGASAVALGLAVAVGFKLALVAGVAALDTPSARDLARLGEQQADARRMLGGVSDRAMANTQSLERSIPDMEAVWREVASVSQTVQADAEAAIQLSSALERSVTQIALLQNEMLELREYVERVDRRSSETRDG